MSLKGVISDKEIKAMNRLEYLSNKADGKIFIRKNKKKRNVAQCKQKNDSEMKIWYLYGIPLNGNTLFNALYILVVIVAICILINSVIVVNTFWSECSLGFLVLSGFLYHYSKTSDIEDKDRKIAELNQRINTLEDSAKSDKIVIELLERELEKAQGNNNG